MERIDPNFKESIVSCDECHEKTRVHKMIIPKFGFTARKLEKAGERKPGRENRSRVFFSEYFYSNEEEVKERQISTEIEKNLLLNNQSVRIKYSPYGWRDLAAIVPVPPGPAAHRPPAGQPARLRAAGRRRRGVHRPPLPRPPRALRGPLPRDAQRGPRRRRGGAHDLLQAIQDELRHRAAGTRCASRSRRVRPRSSRLPAPGLRPRRRGPLPLRRTGQPLRMMAIFADVPRRTSGRAAPGRRGLPRSPSPSSRAARAGHPAPPPVRVVRARRRLHRRRPRDPHVLAIKQTLYRTSADSPHRRARSSRAAENGKQVTVLVELQGALRRGDQHPWARALEEAGVHVVYGLIGLKTHCKMALVVRREGDGIRRYVHLGTGNYNPTTARALHRPRRSSPRAPAIGDDVDRAVQPAHRLLAQPPTLEALRGRAARAARAASLELIDREASTRARASRARIIAKMNALVDPTVIDALYAARRRPACEIDLHRARHLLPAPRRARRVARTSACARIVDRFLEHARIFYFENGGKRRGLPVVAPTGCRATSTAASR